MGYWQRRQFLAWERSREHFAWWHPAIVAVIGFGIRVWTGGWEAAGVELAESLVYVAAPVVVWAILVYLWNFVKAGQALHDQALAERDSARAEAKAVEHARSELANSRPQAKTGFRRDGNELLLDVRNTGAAGEFWAEISASGSINPIRRFRCAWLDANNGQPRLIPKGDRATIRVASLESSNSVGGLFSWHIFYYSSPALAYPVQYQHSHGFGPEGVIDADLVIEIVLASKPDMLDGVVIRRLRLTRFAAIDDLGSEVAH